MTSKARELQRRMSIDPDAPLPSEASRPTPLRRVPRAPGAEASAPVEEAPPPPRVEEPPRDELPDATAPPTAEPLADVRPSDVAPAKPSARSAPRSKAKPPRARPGDDWVSALDDPAIEDGRHGYRSFYLDDAVFARFRAAVYWTARRHDATGVPDNMSVGVEEYMDEVATDLERRYNDGAAFRATPDQVRAHRKRSGG